MEFRKMHGALPCDAKKTVNGLAHCTARWALQAFGWFCVVLGLIGVVVPGLPTTVFLIIALWAFSKSSERFQYWLWDHPQFGPPLRRWHEHRIIPVQAKMAAASMMTFSFIFVCAYVAETLMIPTIMAVFMAPAAMYVLSRASGVPQNVAYAPVTVARSSSTAARLPNDARSPGSFPS